MDNRDAIENIKKKKLAKCASIIWVVAIIIIIAAGAVINSNKKTEEDKNDLIKKCAAIYSMQLDQTSVEVDDTTPHNFETNVTSCKYQKNAYKDDKDGSKFKADVEKMWEEYKDVTIKDRNRDWYYEQIKL